MDWKALINALKAKSNATVYAMEHDNPKDAIAFGANSIAFAKTL